jgi:lysophospholipase L1-like esterase
MTTAPGGHRFHSLANIGDSISQGFDADDSAPLDLGAAATRPGSVFHDEPTLSWVQGSDPQVGSVAAALRAIDSQLVVTPLSHSGAEIVGSPNGIPNLEKQAGAIAGVKPAPDLVYVLLGGNDVCNRARSTTSDPTENMYSVSQLRTAIVDGLQALAESLPGRSTVRFLSMPRVDLLRDAVASKVVSIRIPSPVGSVGSHLQCATLWELARLSGNGICPIVTSEPSAERRAAIGKRIDEYNAALDDEVRRFNGDRVKNPRGISVHTDWQGALDDGAPRNSSIGTYVFTPEQISQRDCFHPNVVGQRAIAALVQEHVTWSP